VGALLLALFARQWLGGVTGDVLGATAKLAETAFLVCALGVVG
jgi:cobalamin synthase